MQMWAIFSVIHIYLLYRPYFANSPDL